MKDGGSAHFSQASCVSLSLPASVIYPHAKGWHWDSALLRSSLKVLSHMEAFAGHFP